MPDVEKNPSFDLMSQSEVNDAALSLIKSLDDIVKQNFGFEEGAAIPFTITHNGEKIDYSHVDTEEIGKLYQGLSIKSTGGHIFLTGFENQPEENLEDAEVYTSTTEPNTWEAVEYAKSVIAFLNTPAK